MKILALHNKYLVAGGEDQSHLTEIALLKRLGHSVDEYTVDNEVIEKHSLFKIALNTIWSRTYYYRIKKLLAKKEYNLVIIQNYFPLLSPSVHYAIKSSGVPVVQFLRNYRYFCLNGFALRKGEPCQACLGKAPWRGVLHACYRNNRWASLIVALMLITHRISRTWQRKVDIFIALTKFSKNINARAGLPKEKIIIKPNFIYPEPKSGGGAGNYFLFVGRLSEEKGIKILLQAWQLLNGINILKIAGAGPLLDFVKHMSASFPSIEYLGRCSSSEVATLMKNARFLIFPSLWYEGMPRTIIESFSVGTPVLASNIGAAKELVEEGKTGCFFEPGNPESLAQKVLTLVAEPAIGERMRQYARQEFKEKYTLEKNSSVWLDLFDILPIPNHQK